MFSSPTAIVSTSDGRNFIFQSPLDYVSRAGVTYRIPAGATTDGASTPPELWQVLPPFGRYWMAAVLHDAAYRNTLQTAQGESGYVEANLTKSDCDALLLEAMEVIGVPSVERTMIYEGVRFGGGKPPPQN